MISWSFLFSYLGWRNDGRGKTYPPQRIHVRSKELKEDEVLALRIRVVWAFSAIIVYFWGGFLEK